MKVPVLRYVSRPSVRSIRRVPEEDPEDPSPRPAEA